jgi:LmbE family N-acetylglucosaminyl deacetylase
MSPPRLQAFPERGLYYVGLLIVLKGGLTMSDSSVYAMAVAPHPFDNDLGLGGTVARWAREGKDVVYVITTNGDKGSTDPDVRSEDISLVREREQAEAAKILGVKQVVFLRHPDLSLEYTREFMKEILRLILVYRPEVVMTNDPYYRFRGFFSSVDHRVSGQATLDAIWPYALAPNTYRDLMDQGLRPHKVKEVLMWQTDNPDVTFDITDTFETKMAAVSCHKSQISAILASGMKFNDMLKERAMTVAKGKDFKYGEAFKRVEVLQTL